MTASAGQEEDSGKNLCSGYHRNAGECLSRRQLLPNGARMGRISRKLERQSIRLRYNVRDGGFSARIRCAVAVVCCVLPPASGFFVTTSLGMLPRHMSFLGFQGLGPTPGWAGRGALSLRTGTSSRIALAAHNPNCTSFQAVEGLHTTMIQEGMRLPRRLMASVATASSPCVMEGDGASRNYTAEGALRHGQDSREGGIEAVIVGKIIIDEFVLVSFSSTSRCARL